MMSLMILMVSVRFLLHFSTVKGSDKINKKDLNQTYANKNLLNYILHVLGGKTHINTFKRIVVRRCAGINLACSDFGLILFIISIASNTYLTPAHAAVHKF